VTVPDTKLARDVAEDSIRRVWTDSAMT